MVKRLALIFLAMCCIINLFKLYGFSDQQENKIKSLEIEKNFELMKDTSTREKVDFKTKREMLENISSREDRKKRKEILRELSKERDDVTKEKAIIELSKTKDIDVMDELINNLKENDQSKGVASLEGLVNYSTYTKAQNAIVGALSHKIKNIRWKAITVCGNIKLAKCVDGLVKIIDNENDIYVVQASIEALYKIRTKKAINEIKRISTTHKNSKVREMCSNVLSFINKGTKKAKK